MKEELAELLTELEAELVAFVRARAGGALLRQETAEDLVQEFCARLLAPGESDVPAGPALRAWVFRAANNFLCDRRDYWGALKRTGTSVLRSELPKLRGDRGGERSEVADLVSSVTGPSTFAMRREQLRSVTKALDLLLARDRELVAGMAAGLTVEEQAAHLGLSYDAAAQARHRALARLRQCLDLILGRRGG